MRETETALRLATFARGEHAGDPEVEGIDPVGIRYRSITLDNEVWAGRIVTVARAWAVFPGFEALRKRPVQGSGLQNS
jgi:hypothetical protein